VFNIKNIGVLGGDKRQIAMIESLASDGINVTATGFDLANFALEIPKVTLHELIKKNNYIILPLPVTKDKMYLNSPFSEKKIILNENFAEKFKNKHVFCGMKFRLQETSTLWESIDLQDYSQREEFAVKNAVPTAEGAIEIAMREYPGTINGSKCLVAGFGRIGKVLSSMLKGLGAHITASARNPKDLAWIDLHGYNSVKTSEISYTSNYNIIFNTIPSLIFDSYTLAKTAENTLIIDLASAPGGVDFEAAGRLGIKSVQALSIPGKVAPKTAGEIIKSTICNMIEEQFIK